MRRLTIAAVLFLVACDGGQPAETADGSAEPLKTTEQVAAERACSDLTSYNPNATAADATTELRRQEYLTCVDTVLQRTAPGLRGRTEAPV